MKIKKLSSILKCTVCGLHTTRRQVVLGRGVIPAQLLFLGEAPGKSEDLLGEAFVGRSGKILDCIIKDVMRELEMKIDISYYISNTILCRPPDNRDPLPSEILACYENIMSIHKAVNPNIVIFLGKIAEKYYKNPYPVSIPMYHPSFLVRTGGKASPYYLTSVQVLKDALRGML